METLSEKIGITYTEVNGVLLPNLVAGGTDYKIGTWGQRHLHFLKEHHRVRLTSLITQCKLNEYLHNVDVQATELYERLIKQLKERQGVTEQLKADDMMAWVGKMNNIMGQAREIVFEEVINKS